MAAERKGWRHRKTRGAIKTSSRHAESNWPIFGRSGEELEFRAAHGVTAHICPGSTAASAAAASAGVSRPLRGLARRLEFVTAHARAGEARDLDWNKIADSGATLAVYMGKSAAAEVSRNLMKAGLPGATPVLAVENASLPQELIFSTRLDLLPLAVKTAIGDGPAVLLIGEAVRRAQPATMAQESARCA